MTGDLTLCVDGSTYSGSAAVMRGNTVIASRQLENVSGAPRTRDELFMPMVAGCLDDAGVRPVEIARVVCGAGPGSFTSLRVAASIAKGIAVGAGCPLHAVSSLILMLPEEAGRYLATLPAMRDELFAGSFSVDGRDRVDELSAPRIIAASEAGKAAESLNAALVAGVPKAARAASLIAQIVEQGPCDLATWEPTYGRLAEAQVRWEAAHGRPLSAGR
jgi:tRNA threonylcarbamoyladenosine biosynthesis protein TsaB